jgi:hypothetical protein
VAITSTRGFAKPEADTPSLAKCGPLQGQDEKPGLAKPHHPRISGTSSSAKDPERRRAAGIPDDLVMTTKPDLAVAQLGRLIAAGLPVGWAAFDEVYTRSGKLRETCETAGLAYAGIVPCDFSITLASGAVIRADQAVKDAVFERRSCGTGTKGPRLADWALAGTASPRHFLLIRRLISRPDQLTFYLCYAPQGRPATMTYFIAIAGRRWPAVNSASGRSYRLLLGRCRCGVARTVWCQQGAEVCPVVYRELAIYLVQCVVDGAHGNDEPSGDLLAG